MSKMSELDLLVQELKKRQQKLRQSGQRNIP